MGEAKVVPNPNNIKIGSLFYSITYGIDDSTGKWKAYAYVVTHRVYNIQRKKRSKSEKEVDKRFKYDPPKYVYLEDIANSDSAGVRDRFYVKSFMLGDNLPPEMYTTIRQAIVGAIKRQSKYCKAAPILDENISIDEEFKAEERVLRLLKGLLTKWKKNK